MSSTTPIRAGLRETPISEQLLSMQAALMMGRRIKTVAARTTRKEIRAAAKRVLDWTLGVTAALDFAEGAGCGDAVGARGIRAGIEDVREDTERMLRDLKR